MTRGSLCCLTLLPLHELHYTDFPPIARCTGVQREQKHGPCRTARTWYSQGQVPGHSTSPFPSLFSVFGRCWGQGFSLGGSWGADTLAIAKFLHAQALMCTRIWRKRVLCYSWCKLESNKQQWCVCYRQVHLLDSRSRGLAWAGPAPPPLRLTWSQSQLHHSAASAEDGTALGFLLLPSSGLAVPGHSLGPRPALGRHGSCCPGATRVFSTRSGVEPGPAQQRASGSGRKSP